MPDFSKPVAAGVEAVKKNVENRGSDCDMPSLSEAVNYLHIERAHGGFTVGVSGETIIAKTPAEAGKLVEKLLLIEKK